MDRLVLATRPVSSLIRLGRAPRPFTRFLKTIRALALETTGDTSFTLIEIVHMTADFGTVLSTMTSQYLRDGSTTST